MPLLTADIRKILEAKGLVVFGTTVPGGTALITTGVGDRVVDNNHAKVNLTADTVGNIITLTRVANDSTTNNGVNIRTVDALATIGAITLPGYVYTGDFSGCVFYLYKTGPDQVTGVHAYSGSQPVETRSGFFRKKVITQVVREFGPMDFYTRNPAQMICRYPTRGELDVSTGEISLAFLSCVERTTATTYLFSVQGSPAGSRVKRLLKTYHVKF
jgi:hypothetical protein